MENRYKQQIQTQTIAILIVLKSIGACRNTFSNYDVINSVSIDKTEFVSSFTNGSKETVRISAKFNDRGSLNLETIQVKVSNKVVDVADLKQFPNLKEFKEIKTIEAQAGGELVLNSFILSVTPFSEMVDKSVSADKLKERNVLFMTDNRQYLDEMFERMLQS